MLLPHLEYISLYHVGSYMALSSMGVPFLFSLVVTLSLLPAARPLSQTWRKTRPRKSPPSPSCLAGETTAPRRASDAVVGFMFGPTAHRTRPSFTSVLYICIFVALALLSWQVGNARARVWPFCTLSTLNVYVFCWYWWKGSLQPMALWSLFRMQSVFC